MGVLTAPADSGFAESGVTALCTWAGKVLVTGVHASLGFVVGMSTALRMTNVSKDMEDRLRGSSGRQAKRMT